MTIYLYSSMLSQNLDRPGSFVLRSSDDHERVALAETLIIRLSLEVWDP